MPLLEKFTVDLFNQKTELPIYCNKQGVFSCKWPDSVTIILGGIENHFTRKEDLIKVINEVVDKANKLSEIIEYRIYYMIPDKYDDWPYIQVKWRALKKVKRGENERYFWIKSDPFYSTRDVQDEMGIPGWQVLRNQHEPSRNDIHPSYAPSLPCTKENLEFFQSIDTALHLIKAKITTFLSQQDLQKIISDGTQKMLGGL